MIVFLSDPYCQAKERTPDVFYLLNRTYGQYVAPLDTPRSTAAPPSSCRSAQRSPKGKPRAKHGFLVHSFSKKWLPRPAMKKISSTKFRTCLVVLPSLPCFTGTGNEEQLASPRKPIGFLGVARQVLPAQLENNLLDIQTLHTTCFLSLARQYSV
jgi:hypothetical protein